MCVGHMHCSVQSGSRAETGDGSNYFLGLFRGSSPPTRPGETLNAIKRAQRTPAPAGPGGGCCSRGSSAHGSYSRGIATCAGSPRREPIMEKGLHRPTIRAGRNRFRSITQKFFFLRISRVFWPVIGSTRVRSAARTRSSLTPCSRAAFARSDLRLSGPRALPWRRSARRPRPSIFGRAVCRARRARSSAAVVESCRPARDRPKAEPGATCNHLRDRRSPSARLGPSSARRTAPRTC